MSEENKQCQSEPVAYITVSNPSGRGNEYSFDWAIAAEVLPEGEHKLYAQANPCEVERLKEMTENYIKRYVEQQEEIAALGAQLAERDALLREASYWLKRERWADFDDAICKKIDATLPASAEPSAPEVSR